MNTLSDLRATLDTHAERVPDDEATARATAVRHRVAVVRRRRRAVGAGVLSLALVIGGAAVLARRDSRGATPSAPTVLGVKAPEIMHSLGFRYRSDGTSQVVTGSGSLDVAASSWPKLVSWTTDQPATVRLKLPDGEYWASTKSHFRDFVVIPPGAGGDLQVSTTSGKVGLASYDVIGPPPHQLDGDPRAFRGEVAGAQIIGGMEVQTRRLKGWTRVFGHQKGTANVAVLCSGAPTGSHIHVVFRGVEQTSGCDDLATFDPGAGNVIGSVPLGPSGRNGRFHAWISGPGSSKPLVVAKPRTVRMGVSFYAPVHSVRVAGAGMDRTIEYAGHTWRQTEIRRSGGSPIRLQRSTHRPSVAVLGLRFNSNTPSYVRLRATGMPLQQAGFSGQGSGTSQDMWIPPGAHVTVTRSTPGTFGVAIYTLADPPAGG